MHAIPTKYRGISFRSRLEARWAIFFDVLGIKYDYEPEAFELDGYCYLPDFWLLEQKIFYECKPEWPTDDEQAKASRLSEFTNRRVCISVGTPRVYDFIGEEPAVMLFPDGGADSPYLWCECAICGKLGVEYSGLANRLHPKRPDDHPYLSGGPEHDTQRIQIAVERARSHQFWTPEDRQ